MNFPGNFINENVSLMEYLSRPAKWMNYVYMIAGNLLL